MDYLIPQLAKPAFLNVMEAYKETKGVASAKLVDLGCSYGINAALLKYDMDLQELYDLYGTARVEDLDRRELIERDRKIFNEHAEDNSLEIVGVDAAPKAVAYAEEVEIIDETVVGDFEQESFSAKQQDCLDDTDLVISTGCVGYISEKTIEKVVAASHSRQPWMAHYVLRMFSFEPIKDALAELGYVTAKGTQAVRQRKFASKLEQEQVLDRLIDMGLDPSGFETEGWYYADLYVARPVADTSLVPSSDLISQ